MEALVWFGFMLPQKIIVLQGKGGDGKSIYTLLRSTVFGELHSFVAPACFDIEEEFRKQGGQFAGARFITIQECNGGTPLQEAIFKSFVGGDKIGCRPNFGKETEYFSWEYCGKCWEMNLETPSVRGRVAGSSHKYPGPCQAPAGKQRAVYLAVFLTTMSS